MQLAPRKKLEIIIELPLLRRIESILAEAGVRGWTVLPSLEGAGSTGEWRALGFTAGQEKRLLLAVASDEVAGRVLEKLSAFFADYPGIVAVSDVQVLRPERF